LYRKKENTKKDKHMTTTQTKLIIKRDQLVARYYRQSDRFETIAEVRAAKKKIEAQIEAIDAQLEALEN
jgi:hypothetical protein